MSSDIWRAGASTDGFYQFEYGDKAVLSIEPSAIVYPDGIGRPC